MKMIMTIRLFITGVIILLLQIATLATLHGGNDRASARLVGLARANTATARGIDAVGVNPALLAIPHNATVEVSLLPAGVLFGSNFMDLNLYNTYFTGVEDPVSGERVGRHLTEQDKQDILDSFPNGKGNIHADAQVLWFGMSIRGNHMGGLAFTISDRFAANLQVPSDYVKMMFNGFSEFGSTYDFSGTSAHSWWMREYAASYATPRLHLVSFLPWISFGGGVKYVEGYGYFGTDSYDGYISSLGYEEGFRLTGEMNMVTRRASSNFIYDPDMYEFNPLGDPAGTGWGFDLGVAAGISSRVVAGLSITDIGKIQWSENTYASVAHASVEIDDILSSAQQDSLLDAYTGNDEAIEPFSTSLPTAIRAGVAMQVTPGLLVAADYTQGLNDKPSNSTNPRFAVGMEWKPVRFLPVRTGLATGGYNGFTLAFGFGFHMSFFDLEVATENIGLLVNPDKSKHASATISTKFRF